LEALTPEWLVQRNLNGSVTPIAVFISERENMGFIGQAHPIKFGQH
jgi:hypothetical protein